MTAGGTSTARRRYSWIGVLLSAVLVSLLGADPAAQNPPAQITFLSVSGNWHDPTDNLPGNQQGDPVITNGSPTSSVSWGDTTGSQSGYDFTATLPPPIVFPGPGALSSFGTFTHRNFEVDSPWLTSVQLDIVLELDVNGVQTGPLTFTFTFNHEETPNDADPCPYPTPPGEGCTDRVTIVSSPQPTTFNVGGVDYTLDLNFLVDGNPANEYITREGGTINSSGLEGQFVLPPAPLTVEKSGPAAMNIGEFGEFTLDVHNTGTGTAWDLTLRDLFPDGPTGGMCDLTPEILTAQVFQADGVTPVAGKGPLVQGSDYTLAYSAAPACQLDLTMLTASGSIGSDERLIITYRTQLDSDTETGVALTNVAGAVHWFNGESGSVNREEYAPALTNGTVGTPDHQDAHTVTTALAGYAFEKTVANLTSGADPAASAAPGDTLRYTLRFRSFDQALSNFRILDELDALNATPVFEPGTLALVTTPPGADLSATSSTGGAAGTGVIDVRSLNVAAGGEALIVFDITLASPLANGTVATNQSTLLLDDGSTFAVSDDPAVNGGADPDVADDEDPTQVTIVSAPAFQIEKISTDLTGDPDDLLAGETLRYTITVKNAGNENAVNVVLRDAVPANTTYVAGSTTLNGAAIPDAGGGTSPLVAGILIHSPADPTPGSMPADPSSNPANVATIVFDVVVNAGVAGGTIISNQGFVSAPSSGIVDDPSDDPDTPAADDPTRDVVGSLPVLYVEKSGPAEMTLGQWAEFVIDVQNIGVGDAWDVTLRDLLPDGPTGGMCALTPEILSARVFAADGVTPVPGKGPLAAGSDYALTYSAAPACQLDLTLLSAAGTIGPDERLIVRYRTQLDADTQDGAALTNVAGAIQWFDADNSTPTRQSFTRSLTNGTVGIDDHEDAHTVTTALAGYAFEKTVANLTSGANPAASAAPGDTLRYTLRFRSFDEALSNFRILDELDALNATPVFEPGTLALVTTPPGADVSATSSTGGTAGTGVVDVRSLNVAAGGEALIVFDITLASPLANGTIATNQSTLLLDDGSTFAVSDDPAVNGVANPNVPGDEDPTRVTIVSSPAFQIEKISTDLTGDPAVLLAGETLRYTITVKNVGNENAVNVVLRDAVPANTTYVAGSTTLNGAAIPDAGGGTSPLVAGIPIRSPADPTPGSMPADPSSNPANVATIVFDVVVNAGVADGTIISNQGFVSAPASGIVDDPSDDPDTPAADDPTRDVVGSLPVLYVAKSGPAAMTLGQWAEFVIDVQNIGVGDAWNVSLRDLLPDGPTGGMCALTPEILSARVFAADGVTPVAGKGPLAAGSDYTLAYSGAPGCQLDLTLLSAAGTIGPDERLIVRYRTQLDADTQDGAALTNVAGAIQWFDADSGNPARQSFTRALTNGTVGVDDHEDAHTVNVVLTGYFFEKTAANLTSGANPAASAAPGDTLRYTLRVRSPDEALSNFRILDELDALNATPVFVPGSLALVTTPPGADVSATSSTGGAAGTGVVDVRSLNVAAGGEAVIVFDITLASPLANGTIVTNQSTLLLDDGSTLAVSDDPAVNGVADPNVPGDEDPTRVPIVSSPAFQIEKISTDLTGDPAVLLAGETLRYTITVKNVGNENAANVVLRDAVPVNTTYVAGSTALNGAAVPDAGGTSPLVNGMPIHSPADPTAGSMPADASSNPANVATITFDVVVNPDVVDGTIVANQGFVSAVDRGIVDRPSDDPSTPIADDPTRDIVGNLPLLYAEKRVALTVDLGSPGIVDPGDVLRYSITIQNSGAVPATGVVLTDQVPANTTYVANSTNLNGLAVGQPDGGVSPLASGIDISSSDLTPPLPGAGAGTISPGATAVLEFDLRVENGTPAGTLISNQAVVVSTELPDLPTDGDGDPTTGPEPTVVVVGNVQQLSITKQVAVVGGGAALPGSELEYVVRVVNVAAVPAFDVVVTDDLDAGQPGQLAYVGLSATMNGSSAGVSFAGSTITANYSAVNGALAPGETIVLRFRATLSPGLADGTVVTNTGVVAWNTPTQTAQASVSVVVGGIPGVSMLSGSAWHDADFDAVMDAEERALAGWAVDLYRDTTLVHTALTDADGAYRIIGVEPNDGSGIAYELRFRAPGAGANTATLGLAASPFTNGPQRIADIVLPSGANLQNLSLPIQPNGVVYNSVARTPIAGATLRLLNAGSGVPVAAGCFDDAAQQGQVTLADGYYKFDVNFTDPSCPSGGNYLIDVTAPAGTIYVQGLSQIIPAATSAATAAFPVPACRGGIDDAVPGTALYCEVQASESAPAIAVPARSAGTTYHVHLTIDGSQPPGTSQIFNNHLPIDPELSGAMTITKTTPLLNVTRGQLVPYVITVRNAAGLQLSDVTIVDQIPAGFGYVQGSARLDDVPAEPITAGRELRWEGLVIAGAEVRTVRLLLVVGAGVTGGEFVNRARALNSFTGTLLSGEATATVRVIPDPTFDCTDVTGKVFNDINRNGIQDAGEEGLPGVRIVTTWGLQVTTDQYGRYHITCALTDEGRAGNFVLRIDDRTLPSGYRMSTDRVLIQRATSGKSLRFNFGASVHRVVGIDFSDEVFEPGTTDIRVQWRPRLDLLLDEMCKAPSVLRLSYVADTEEAALVERRLEAVKRQVTGAWDAAACGYQPTIEPEIFWRLGAPREQPDARLRGNR